MKKPIESARRIGIEQDWRPEPREEGVRGFLTLLMQTVLKSERKFSFWKILTGHSRVFGTRDIGRFIDPKTKQIVLPPSELEFVSKTGSATSISAGEAFDPKRAIHASWLGIHDTTRMYVFNKKGFTKLLEELNSKEIFYELLTNGLGVKVATTISTVVRDKKTGTVQPGQVYGVVFFLNEEKLQTPTDALSLATEIAKLNPETAERLVGFLLVEARIVAHNLQVWQTVISDYEAGRVSELPQISELPPSFKEIFEQLKSYLEQTSNNLRDFFEQLRTFDTPPLDTIPNLPLPLVDEQKVKQHLQKILKIISKLSTSLNETNKAQKTPKEKLERLKRRLERNLSRTPEVVNRAVDPQELLLATVAEIGREKMLDRMEPSDAMIRSFIETQGAGQSWYRDFWRKDSVNTWHNSLHAQSREMVSKNPNFERITNLKQIINQSRAQVIEEWNKLYPNQPIPKNLREWIEKMGIKKEMDKLRKDLVDAEAKLVEPEEKAAYTQVSQAVKAKIQEIMQQTTAEDQQEQLNWYDFPLHPVLTRWKEIIQLIKNFKLPETLEEKIINIFEIKTELAKKQKDYTDLFLKTTIKYMPGGYNGWNKKNGEFRNLIESTPYFASVFQDLNCVGRTILLSGILMAAGVFEGKDLKTTSTHNHLFLSAIDTLGIGRVIEGSGYPEESYYFGIPQEKFFVDQSLKQIEIISQQPLRTGLLISAGNNYLTDLKDSEVKGLYPELLQISKYIQDNLWYNLSTVYWSGIDFLLCFSRVASINYFHPGPFLALYSKFRKISNNLEKVNTSSQLLPYIKLNFLVMQKALEDRDIFPILEEKLKEEITQKFNTPRESDFYVEEIKRNLQILLNNLSPVEIPPYWQNKYGPNLERATIEQMRDDLWNPNLFPKPIGFDDKDQLIWQLPN